MSIRFRRVAPSSWLLAVVASAIAGAPAASAGQYEVRSCASSAEGRADAWVSWSRPEAAAGQSNWCGDATAGDHDFWVDYRGALSVRTPITGPPERTVPEGLVASLTLTAPPGAELQSLQYNRTLDTNEPGVSVRLVADGLVLEECVRPLGDYHCTALNANPNRTFPLGGVSGTMVEIQCEDGPCSFGLGNAAIAAAVVRSSIVTIEENVAPTVSALAVSPNGAGWVGGAGQATLSGADHLGIRRLELIRAGAVVATFPNPACVDWSTRPCAEPTTGAGTTYAPTVNAAALGLADGEHSVRVRAIDAAGNATESAPANLKLDTTAPLAEFLLGGGATPDATRTLTWATPVPGEGSPLVQTRVLLCPPGAAPANCTAHQPTGERAFSFQLPNDGDRVDARVEITDAAGNVAVTPPTLFERRASATGPGTTPPGDPNSGPSPSPGPGTTPPAKRSPRLTARFRRTLSKGPFTIRGSVTRGAASRITVTASGRSRTGKVVRTRVRIKPRASGGYSVRVRLPARMVRKRGLRIEIVAKPNATYRAATLRRTLREPRR